MLAGFLATVTIFFFEICLDRPVVVDAFDIAAVVFEELLLDVNVTYDCSNLSGFGKGI